MLNEFVYCPRLAYLEWVQGEFEDNAYTIEGRFRHKKVDQPGGAVADPDETAESKPEAARSVLLSDDALGLIAKIDLLESDGNAVMPIDYKRGTAPDIEHGAWDPERVQVCAQGLLLRAHGYACDEGALWFAASRRRVAIPFTDELVDLTRRSITELRAAADAGIIPPPLLDSPKCPRCSLVGICLPDETHALAMGDAAERTLEPTGDAEPLRPIAVQDRPGRPMHVTEPGARVGRRSERLVVQLKGETLAEVRVVDVSELCVHGNVQVTTQAIRLLASRNVAVSYFSGGGKFEAITTGLAHKNVELRIRQFARHADATQRVAIARAFVAGKIRNQRTLLRRNATDIASDSLDELSTLAKRAAECTDIPTLLGFEGAAARRYFLEFPRMVQPGKQLDFDFKTRNRRPPKDPTNALLSFVYSLLTRDLAGACITVGLDPHLGYLHAPRYGRPSLALDLAEEFRALLADSTVLTLINNGEVRASDFVTNPLGCNLTKRGRRQVLQAYARRLDQQVQHPLFGYRLSYRRVLLVQARLLSRHLLDEIPDYPPFCTR